MLKQVALPHTIERRTSQERIQTFSRHVELKRKQTAWGSAVGMDAHRARKYRLHTSTVDAADSKTATDRVH